MQYGEGHEGTDRPRGLRRILGGVFGRSGAVARGVGGAGAGVRRFEDVVLGPAQERRLSLVLRRQEHIEEVRRMCTVVLLWPAMATVFSVVALVSTSRPRTVAVGLALLYGLGTGVRRLLPRRRMGESERALGARWRRKRVVTGLVSAAVLVLLALRLHAISPVLVQLVGVAALVGHLAYRYAYWRQDLFVRSTTALWRFQGLIHLRVASLELSKILAGPNVTSVIVGIPIGTIEMDSAAQTGDILMSRVGPLWRAEDLAVRIFEQRKALGMRGHPPAPAGERDWGEERQADTGATEGSPRGAPGATRPGAGG